MTRQYSASLLVVVMLFACLPISAQNLVSRKLLPPASALRTRTATAHFALGMGDDSSQTSTKPRRHWSKGGKIMTIIGAGLIGAGTAALIHGQDTQVACNNGTCVDVAWKATGAIWMGGGAALVIIGATRRTED